MRVTTRLHTHKHADVMCRGSVACHVKDTDRGKLLPLLLLLLQPDPSTTCKQRGHMTTPARKEHSHNGLRPPPQVCKLGCTTET